MPTSWSLWILSHIHSSDCSISTAATNIYKKMALTTKHVLHGQHEIKNFSDVKLCRYTNQENAYLKKETHVYPKVSGLTNFLR